MNYYLARDGQTFGPYSAASFPGMLQAGQVVPADLVCQEGGSQWVELSTVPALAGTAAPAAPGNSLRVSTPSPRTSAPPMMTTAPQYAPVRPRTSGWETVGNVWHSLKAIFSIGIAVLVVVALVAGYFISQRQKREIAKLASQPGWSSFQSANSLIDSESTQAGYGKDAETTKLSQLLVTMLSSIEKAAFTTERSSYRGRSKLGRVLGAVNNATAGTGKFETYVEFRNDRALVLIHVPEYTSYKGEAKDAMREICWGASAGMIAAELEELAEKSKPAPRLVNTATTARPAPRTTTTTRTNPRGTTTTAVPTRTVPTPAPKPAIPLDPKGTTVVVGIRGSSSYDCVYVIPVSPTDDFENKTISPTITGNVESHKLLVKWFGPDKP